MNSSTPLSSAEQQRGLQSSLWLMIAILLVAQDRPMQTRQPARRATGSSDSMSTCSCSAWAPSPTAPRPSNVGTPSAAVKFPSEPPPVPPSPSSCPSSARHLSGLLVQTRDLGAAFQRRAIEAAAQPHDRARASTGRRPRNAASTSVARRPRVGTRTSTVARASSAMTFGREPPDTAPTLTEMPRCEVLQARRCARIWCASSCMALAPFSARCPRAPRRRERRAR